MQRERPFKYRDQIWKVSSAIASILLLQFVVRNYYEPSWFVFDPFITLLYWGFFVLTFLCIAISALTNRTGARGALRLPLIFLLVTLAVSVLFLIMSKRRAEVPIVFSAYYDGDYNGVGVKLRSDGSFEAVDGSILGDDILYGDYRLAGDTIILGAERFRFDNARWRFARCMLITCEDVICAYDPTGKDNSTFVMRITQDDLGASDGR